jgi:lactobin A/cerein 7B family class IIb bacteriocin
MIVAQLFKIKDNIKELDIMLESNVNLSKFSSVTENELEEFEGGIGIVSAGLIIAGGVYLSGVFVGYTDGKKKK